jgi:hypothetical protein
MDRLSVDLVSLKVVYVIGFEWKKENEFEYLEMR